ncbi:MAG: hypothetical protein KGZ58_11115 [Ignavibacteriales bacterium]|nr:hypothetical protein [Ignavibacteriales bacterium]
MVIDSFTVRGETASLNQEKSKQNFDSNRGENLPLRKSKTSRKKLRRVTLFLVSFIVLMVWLILLMLNYFYVQSMTDQNYQLGEKIQKMEDEITGYRSRLDSKTSFDVITKNASLKLGLKHLTDPTIELSSEKRGGVP